MEYPKLLYAYSIKIHNMTTKLLDKVLKVFYMIKNINIYYIVN